MSKNFVSRQQLSLLPERIRKSLETFASDNLFKYLWRIYEEKNYNPIKVLIVGCGGSYPASLAVAQCIRETMLTPYVDVETPQTAIRIFNQFDKLTKCTWIPKYDLVIGISYSGKTPDIKAISQVCISREHPIRFVLLTGAPVSSLKRLYHENQYIKIISYFNDKDRTGFERGIVSMFSTLAPMFIFDEQTNPIILSNGFENYDKLLQEGEESISKLNIPAIAQSIKKHPVIHVFYEWRTYPTAADIESKFTESGLANVILHEKKNFSHGRYTALYNLDFALVINLTMYDVVIASNTSKTILSYQNDYDKIIADFLEKRCLETSAQYLELGNIISTPFGWNITEMCKIPYLITAIGEELDIDISKPFSNSQTEPTFLYNYKGFF